MLFKHHFHDGLRDGTIDLTVRQWRSAQVKVGGVYRFGRNAVIARLDRMDRLSQRGPWTSSVLTLIADNPKRRAGDLAPTLNQELQRFKASVRKLKALGLTQSHDIGYELTALGKQVLKIRT